MDAGEHERGDITRLHSGRYAVQATDGGAGSSAFGALGVTWWDGDVIREAGGFFIYLRETDAPAARATTLQPTVALPDRYVVRRSDVAVQYLRTDGAMEVETTICLAPEGDAELRRVCIRNTGPAPIRLAVTTYAELALNGAAAVAAHPAFSRLFVQTEYVPAYEALVARRRLRSPDDRAMHVVHMFATDGHEAAPVEWETDRWRFLGRGRGTDAPRALDHGVRLAGTTGNVLDPIVALRRTVEIPSGETATLTAILGAGDDRPAVEAILARYNNPAAIAALFTALPAWTTTASPVVQRYGKQQHAAPDAVFTGHRAPATPDASDASHTSDAADAPAPPSDTPPRERLLYHNGIGGFSTDGTEYVLRVQEDGDHEPRLPPCPWVNVVANANIGFVISERGAGNTWSINSRENRLTPWLNDPVTDRNAEALYLRDETSGAVWSPAVGAVRGEGTYEVRHGFGYTVTRHVHGDLSEDVWHSVAEHDPVRITHLRMANTGEHPRRIAVYAYHELVLGALPPGRAGMVRTWHNAGAQVLLAANPANEVFAERVAFAAMASDALVAGTHSWSADRETFLGRYGRVEAPRAVYTGGDLDRKVGAGLDPCFALRGVIDVPPGGSAEVVFVLGEGENEAEARALATRYASAVAATRSLDAVRDTWRALLSAVQVTTPSPVIDLMVNGWLIYQNVACRMLGRTAFYQSGGAFGFRDQLQDAGALIAIAPDVARNQLLLHAAHQFVEGDVLHWWHPPRSGGIRTRFSDDLLWLPYIAATYVHMTGDHEVLEEHAPFLTADMLEPDEDEIFVVPQDSGERGSLYEHCCRALDRSMARGAHDLPLMGSGDWNDGMNRVGREGRGESVWLGFFLVEILNDFLPLCERRGDAERAARYRAFRAELHAALNDAGWDGAWYRRAYYDNGEPLGSATSDEGRIDAIAQAWAVTSGVAPAERARMALDALETYLIAEGDGVIRLLTPAFDRTPNDPGYIKGYLPGVRENGGQYTHGALWVVRALAVAGRHERAVPLLEMLSPVSHARTPAEVDVYRVEPYVIAADVYGVAPHVGRGGWTWYTGSAGWMFRVALESILGMQLTGGEALRVHPCIPDAWPGFTLRYRRPACGTTYVIAITRTAARTASLDGEALALQDGEIVVPLAGDGGVHHVNVGWPVGGDVAVAPGA